MDFITWNDNYSVGINQLDEQHKHIVSMLNDLHVAMRERKGKEFVEKVLVELVNYSEEHFNSEEKLFDEYDFPGSEAHKAEHDKFIDDVLAFKKDFDAGKLFLSIKVMDFLKDWLLKHILATDKEYTEFFNKQGVH